MIETGARLTQSARKLQLDECLIGEKETSSNFSWIVIYCLPHNMQIKLCLPDLITDQVYFRKSGEFANLQ